MSDGMELTMDTTVLDQLITNNPEQADQWLRGVGQQILSQIVLSFGDSPAGNTYKRGGVTHVASQPGNPPNVDIGTLRASMRLETIGQLHYQIQDGVEYGIYLEEGTENMQARPFVRPVFHEWREAKLAQEMKSAGWLP